MPKLRNGCSVLGSLVASAILIVGCTSKTDIKQAEAHYKMGYSMLLDQQMQPAFVEFQKALELNPKDRDTHYALGHIYFLQEKFPEAEGEFKQVLKLDGRYPEGWNYLGTVYYEQGKSDQALQAFDRALSFPQYATPDFAHYNKGRVFVKKGWFDEAFSEFRAALRINPKSAMAAYEAGRLSLEHKTPKDAVDLLRVTVQEKPDFTEAHWYLAQAYARSGMSSQALDAYRKVIALAPGSRWAEDAKAQIQQLTR